MNQTGSLGQKRFLKLEAAGMVTFPLSPQHPQPQLRYQPSKCPWPGKGGPGGKEKEGIFPKRHPYQNILLFLSSHSMTLDASG